VRLCGSQYGDLEFERRDDVTLSGVPGHAGGQDLSAAGVLGALLAGADDSRIAYLRAFGRTLGIAFQVVDDLLASVATRRSPQAGRRGPASPQDDTP
jgi:geranylgeranyl pyrophosphate synthase